MSSSHASLQQSARRVSAPRVDSASHNRPTLHVHPNRGYRINRPTHFCPHYIALVTLVVIFICSLYFAITNWRGVEKDPAPHAWNKTVCTLVSEVKSRKGSSTKFYQVYANVTLPPDDSKTYTAYYGPEEKLPHFTKEEAKEKALQLNKKAASKNNQLPCWKESSSNPPSISLSAITQSASVYLAWTGTFLAAIVGVVIITVFSNSMHSPLGVNYMREPLVMRPPAAKSVHLTERQALRVCNRFAQDIRPQSRDVDWTCSICLDDDQNTDLIKTVVLPCDHRFHTMCIKRWLWKGKGECPLCKWDARSFIDAEKKAEAERSASATEVATDSSTYGSSGMLNSFGIPRNTPVSARPSSNGGANASQDVSHITIDTVMLEAASNAAATAERISNSNATTEDRGTSTDSPRNSTRSSSRPPRPP